MAAQQESEELKSSLRTLQVSISPVLGSAGMRLGRAGQGGWDRSGGKTQMRVVLPSPVCHMLSATPYCPEATFGECRPNLLLAVELFEFNIRVLKVDRD